MKTLVVLSALMAVALAAPALFEDGSEDFKKITTNVPVIFKRERKSPLETSHQDNPTPGTPASPMTQISEFGVSGRSFGLKKPIIIKKKSVGYHVYRDSDEEIAESGETCGKQVKLKFCDAKPEDKMKSSNDEDLKNQMTIEEDVQHSIKIAKEAVDKLRHDFQMIERKPGTQSSLWNHGKSESDVELHQDIEDAREALEHIHKNFGNLESMSLHATTLKNEDNVDDAQFTIAKTEEQRLVQWKEAMDTIQKNVEIARNIEDSFKTASAESGLLFNDGTTTNNHNNKQDINTITDHMRTTNDVVTKGENKVDSENCKVDHTHEKTSEKDNTKPVFPEEDMTSSASTISEKNIEDSHNTEKTRHTSEQSGDTRIEKTLSVDKPVEKISKEKSADTHSMNLQASLQKDSEILDSMKPKERKTDLEELTKKMAFAENSASVPETANLMKSVESEDMLLEQQRHTVAATDENHKSLKHDQLLEKMEITDKIRPEMKSAEHVNEQLSNINKKEDKIQNKDLHTKEAKEVDTTMFAKSTEEVSTNTQKDLLTKAKLQENKMQDGNFEQHEAKMANQENMKQQSVMIAPTNSEPGKFHQEKQSMSELHPEMRGIENFKNVQQHQLTDPSQTRWAGDKNLHMQMESMKAASDMHSQTTDHVHTVQHPGHHHHLTHNGHEQHHSRFPDNFMAQGKSADGDMQSYYMGMRDGSGMGPENHRLRWKPTHESLRNAYGAPAAPAAASSSSSGAVGLFPNANVGSCGIPLLLSCNPSVVSGSLAKAHPAPYSAPAYRTDEDFNFHTKRDVKKTHEKLSSPHNRTPNTNQKTSTVLVAKQ